MNESQLKHTENSMGTRSVFPLLCSMALPPMISMLIQSLYNIVDGMFVSQISQDALNAVSLVFPLQNLVLSVAVGFGVGINSCMSRNLGANNREQVNQTASHGVLFTLLHSLLFVALGLFVTRPFLSLYTDSAEVLRMGCDYSYVVLCFAFGSLLHILIEKMFQAVGNMILPMFLQAIGAIINIVLDPILIFGKFGLPALGVKGAAIATVIGQITACGLAVLAFYRSRKKHGISVSFRGFRLNGHVVKSIYSVAIPSGLMVVLPSVLVSLLNGILSSISQTAVTVFGLYYKLQTFVYMPANGLIQGMRPIVGYNFGAGRIDRVKQTLKYSSFLIIGMMLVGMGVFWLLPEQIMGLFRAEGDLLIWGKTALRTISLGFVLSTAGIVISGAMEALGKGISSLAITLLRQLIVVPPLAWLLSKSFGIMGVWAAFPIGEVCAALTAVVIFGRQLRVWNGQKRSA